MIRISPGADGTTRRDHIEQAAEQLGKAPEELWPVDDEADDAPEIPEDGLYLWNWFQELSAGRGNNGFGPTAITWADMEAWARLTAIEPTPFETLTLRSMDAAFLSTHAAEAEKRNKRAKK